MANYIWIYKPRDKEYFVARHNSFGFYETVLDRHSGSYALQLVQGIQMEMPAAWDWKVKEQGHVFAGLSGAVYDITELERAFIPRL